jgi:tRNA(Arg) A34 adenosine deaminase TadA
MCLAAAYWARVARIVYANPRAVAAAAGFCDDDLYTELARPAGARRISMERLILPDAEAPLIAWRDKDDKTPY